MRFLTICSVSIFLLLSASMHADILVCIHGFLTEGKSMRAVARAGGEIGFKPYIWSYPSRDGTIEQHGRRLAHFLNELAIQQPGETIHFVTHSIGALVLRSALNLPSCPREALLGKAILVAPPNQGCTLARKFQNFFLLRFWMGSKSGWEMLHDDHESLKRLGCFPCNMPILVIAGTRGVKLGIDGPNDGLLMVEETYLDTPFSFQSFALSHGGLLRARSVWRLMQRFLLCN